MCPTESHAKVLAHSLWWSAGRLGTLEVGTSKRKWVTRGKTLKFTSISSLFSMSFPLCSELLLHTLLLLLMLALIADARTRCLTDSCEAMSQSKYYLVLSSLCQAPVRDKKTREKVFTTSEYHLPWIHLRHVWIHRFLQYYCVEML